MEILISSSLQVPQDLGLSQDSSVWWSPLESGPGAHVRREVRGEERLPHSLSGGPGNTQDLPQEDRWHQGWRLRNTFTYHDIPCEIFQFTFTENISTLNLVLTSVM